jgi:uncharacterized protein YggE
MTEENRRMSLRKLVLFTLFGSLLPFSSPAQVSAIYPSRATMITGECEADLKPSVAVISGGVATSALKPTAAATQLDKQLALLQAYVQQNRGTLKELERVRMIHTEGSNNGQPRDPEFQVAQRFHAEFPVDAPMDRRPKVASQSPGRRMRFHGAADCHQVSGLALG